MWVPPSLIPDGDHFIGEIEGVGPEISPEQRDRATNVDDLDGRGVGPDLRPGEIERIRDARADTERHDPWSELDDDRGISEAEAREIHNDGFLQKSAKEWHDL